MSKVLVIGDLHEPFALNGYLAWIKTKARKYKTNKTVFIGDVIDNHYSSYHETDADGLGGDDELQAAIDKIKSWYKAFPKATVIVGNHDRMASRKATSSNVPSAWIRDYSDVLGTPGWVFTERKIIDGVQYIHGEGPSARKQMKEDMMSTVQGHRHTECYVEYGAGENCRVFGVQTGCGIDRHAYAMAYARNFKHPFIGCAVIIDGELPIVFSMPLKNKV